MAMSSLYLMGASSERMKDFDSYYCKKLEPRTPPTITINSSNWREYLGRKEPGIYESYLDFFQREKNQLGAEELLSKYFPQLMDGLITAAFHPLLVLGFAFEFERPNADLVARGLAHLCYAFFSLGTLGENPESQNSPKEILESAFKDATPPFAKKFQEAVREVKVSNALERYDLRVTLENVESTVGEVSLLMAQLYDVTSNFFVLHGVTGSRAFRRVVGHLKDEDKSLATQYLVRAIIAAYFAVGKPALEFSKEESLGPWENVLASGLLSNDEHVIKMVFSCWKESQLVKSPFYFACANLVTKRGS